MTHVRRLLGTVALATVALLAALLLAEVVLRLLDVAPASGVTTVTEREFERVPGILTPSQAVLDTQLPELPHQVTVNALGFRGEEFTLEKPPGEVRILMLGDSFVYGSFVEDQETYPFRLQQELAGPCSGIRVINAGVPGSTILTHRAMMERGLALDPDLVILSFTENDVSDLASEPMWDQLARNRATKSSFPLGLIYPVVRSTALWQLLLRSRGLIRAREGDGVVEELDAAVEERSSGPRSTPALRSRYAAEFGSMVRQLNETGIPFVFTSFPAHLTVYGEWTEEQIHWVHALSEENGVPAITILEALRRTGLSETELYLLPWDGHPSATGYEVAARVLREELLASEPLGRRCSPGIPQDPPALR